MASTPYDPQVLQTLVDKLYSRATSIVAVYGLFGLLAGLGLAASLAAYGGIRSMGLLVAVGALVTASVIYVGEQKANQLRIQAQTLLLSMQIEVNTRPR